MKILNLFAPAIVLTAVIIAAPATAQTAFGTCVVRSIHELDDSISPANVIAAGAVENCQDVLRQIEPELGRNANALEIAIAGLKDAYIPAVLKHRATIRAHPIQKAITVAPGR